MPVRILSLRSFGQGVDLRILPSKFCFLDFAVRILPSGSCHQDHAIRILFSGSCHQNLAVRILPLGFCRQSLARQDLAIRTLLVRDLTSVNDRKYLASGSGLLPQHRRGPRRIRESVPYFPTPNMKGFGCCSGR